MADRVFEAFKQFVLDYWTFGAATICGIILFGLLVGSLKKLTATLFMATLGMGERTANALLDKPKGVALGFILLGVGLPCFLLGWRNSPIQYVEKPVRVEVPDVGAISRLEGEIDRLKGLLAATKGEKSEVVAKAVQAEDSLREARGEVSGLNDRIAALANEKAEVEKKLARFLPPPQPDKDRARQLIASLDRKHMKESHEYFCGHYNDYVLDKDDDGELVKTPLIQKLLLAQHTWRRPVEKFDVNSDDIEYRSKYLKGKLNFTTYHKRCDNCEVNRTANLELDEIGKRNGWGFDDFDNLFPFKGDEHVVKKAKKP